MKTTTKINLGKKGPLVSKLGLGCMRMSSVWGGPVNDEKESERIRGMAKARKKLVNVADKPELCDFYMSSIVKKGNLKIAISTNGKSPTIAKRLKEVFQKLLPDELDDLLDKMSIIRSKLKGDLAGKVKKLNEITEDMVS